MLKATLGEEAPIQVQVSTGQTNLFARAKIYNINGGLVTSLSLPHLVEGLYGDTYIFSSAGHYTVVYQLFTDSGFLTASDFDIQAEVIEANSDKTNLVKLLGLTYDNSVLDSHVYDGDGLLLSVRVRNYDSKTNALLGGAAGLVNTWNISATYVGGRLNTYKVLRD
jgi:hypothetical protein